MDVITLNDELKPCPFCGGEIDTIIKDDTQCFVVCRNCGCKGAPSYAITEEDAIVYDTTTKEHSNTEAIEKWNKRIGDRNKFVPVFVRPSSITTNEQAEGVGVRASPPTYERTEGDDDGRI